MDILPKIKPKNQEILEKLSEMVNYTKDEFTRKPIYKNKLNLKQILLVSMFAAVNSYTEAIFELCKQSRPEAAIVILRSIVEAWINSMYVLGHPNDRLLYLFAIEDSYYRKSLVQLLQDYYTRYPKQRKKIFTRQKLRDMSKVPSDELAYYKSKLGISFKKKKEFDKEWGSLLDRAIGIDQKLKTKQKDKSGGVEHTYLLAYKHLSEYVHLSMRGIQHFWINNDKGDMLILDKNPNNIDLVLKSSFTFYLYFASKLKQYKIIDCSLAKYHNFFKKKLYEPSV